jgi:hypothetical protein
MRHYWLLCFTSFLLLSLSLLLVNNNNSSTAYLSTSIHSRWHSQTVFLSRYVPHIPKLIPPATNIQLANIVVFLFSLGSNVYSVAGPDNMYASTKVCKPFCILYIPKLTNRKHTSPLPQWHSGYGPSSTCYCSEPCFSNSPNEEKRLSSILSDGDLLFWVYSTLSTSSFGLGIGIS